MDHLGLNLLGVLPMALLLWYSHGQPFNTAAAKLIPFCSPNPNEDIY